MSEVLLDLGGLPGYLTYHGAPECDGEVKWDCCNIGWPIRDLSAIISEEDAAAGTFADFDFPFV